MAMGRNLMEQVVSIVKLKTILAWQRKLEKQKWDYSDRRKRNPSRPRIAQDIEQLVCQMARENEWGYERIQDELKKLDIRISKSNVAHILRRNGLPPSPERNGLIWRVFLARHEDVFLCADLFTKEIWTFKGLQTAHIFFVIHLGTRKLLYTHVTFSPHTEWLKQQARQMMWACDEQGIQPRYFLHDNDACFSKAFDTLLGDQEIEPVKTPFKAPSANSVAERYVLSAKTKCLNHLYRILKTHQGFFNQHRPHQGIDNQIPSKYTKSDKWQGSNKDITARPIGREDFLGGLSKSYQRAA